MSEHLGEKKWAAGVRESHSDLSLWLRSRGNEAKWRRGDTVEQVNYYSAAQLVEEHEGLQAENADLERQLAEARARTAAIETEVALMHRDMRMIAGYGDCPHCDGGRDLAPDGDCGDCDGSGCFAPDIDAAADIADMAIKRYRELHGALTTTEEPEDGK